MNKTFYTLLLLCFVVTNGYSQFGTISIIDSSFTTSIRKIITTDVDNDGKKDIISSLYSNDVYWYKNLGTGFSAPQNITATFPNPYHIDVADANGDGLIDLLLTNNYGNNSSVSVYFNVGGGVSWNPLTIDTGLVLGAFKSFFIDAENDGDLDILTNADTKITLYKNDGNGVFTSPIILANSSEYYSLTVNDFTNDGYQDFIVHAGTETLLYKNNTLGSFLSPITLGSFGVKIFLSSVDIDNDGDVDMICQDPDLPNEMQFFKNDGLGVFTFDHNEINYHCTDHNTKLKEIKLDLDNFKDILYIDNVTNDLKWRTNNQLGTFVSSSTIDSNFLFTSIYADDIDNDGDNDIIWFGIKSGKSYLGTFTNKTITLNSSSYFLSNNNISVFPNPAINNIEIIIERPIKEVLLFNSIGSLILLAHQKNIDINDLNSGSYFVIVKDKDENVFWSKIVLKGGAN